MVEISEFEPQAHGKFSNPDITATGHRRARVELGHLRTLWFNTGTLCNLTCANCYIKSSPVNDSLVYLDASDVASYLDQLLDSTEEIGFTGGEPFMNPAIIIMLEEALRRGYRVLVLTNALRPMMKQADALLALNNRYGERLILRVSLDHYTKALYEVERGKRTWEPTLIGLDWLVSNGFQVNIAGRTMWNESESSLRSGYAALFAERGYGLDAADRTSLVLFPEMDETADVPEITESCWDILGVAPEAMMCASSRMVIKRKDAAKPSIVPCTLLADDPAFDMGKTLAEAAGSVSLNHPHCARFCVLGGGACSASARP